MDQEKTVRVTGDETVALTGEPTVPVMGEPTMRLGADESTMRLNAGEPTMRLNAGETGRVTGEETVTFGGEPTVRVSAQPTVHLAPPPGYPGSPAPPGYPGSPAPPTHLGRPAVPAPSTARTTPGTRYVTGRAGDTRVGEPAQAAEVRFGPGVPAPAAAPAWRPAAPARPRRSPWRLVSSILSTLLTIALLVAVGLYLWQRLSPLEVGSVSVAVPQSPGQRCDTTVDVVATVRTNGKAGTLRYQWLRSGTEPTAILTERIGRGQQTATLHLKWAFSGVGTTTETATINITEPSPVQAQTTVTYDCPRD